MPKLHKLLYAALGGALVAFALPAFAEDAKPAEPAKAEGGDEKAKEKARIQSFQEALQKTDPEAAKRFGELRDNRDKALEHLKKVQEELKTTAGEAKINVYQEYKTARKKYAEAYIAFIGFLDERDQKRIVQIDDNIKKLEAAKVQIRSVMDTRKKAKEELEAELKKID